MTKKQKRVLIRIIVSFFALLVSVLLPAEGVARLGIFMIPYIIIGYDILKKAFLGIVNLQPFDENFLMAVATLGAVTLGEYSEAVAVMLFYQVGELFQSCAVGKSRKSIASLMDIRPDYANIKDENGELVQVSPYDVAQGDEIVVLPGERVPLDGVVISGKTHLDTSALTGESVPRSVCVGDEIHSGCINVSGMISVRTTKEFLQSTVSKILDLVENASSKKSRSEQFISKFARVYTPIICVFALILALGAPSVRYTLGLSPEFGVWVYRALTFLVISCPCALVISIPLSFFAGIGGASSVGVLIKGSNYIETLSRVDTVMFDKTGTLTEGVFRVREISGDDNMLEYAAHIESFSTHPIAKSIADAYSGELDLGRVSDVCELSGMGISALVDEKSVSVGNKKLMESLGIEVDSAEGTRVYVSVSNELVGYIVVADAIKDSAKGICDSLKKLGVKNTVMLTGDDKNVAASVAQELGIDKVYSELMPQDKVSAAEREISEHTVAFAGDGINDAPVITRADVGIAMGAIGSDAAIEAADVVIMDDNPQKICKAIKISRKCMRIVYENIAFAIGVKLLCLVLGAAGVANMWAAIFADVGVMVIAVFNAIRAMYVRE